MATPAAPPVSGNVPAAVSGAASVGEDSKLVSIPVASMKAKADAMKKLEELRKSPGMMERLAKRLGPIRHLFTDIVKEIGNFCSAQVELKESMELMCHYGTNVGVAHFVKAEAQKRPWLKEACMSQIQAMLKQSISDGIDFWEVDGVITPEGEFKFAGKFTKDTGISSDGARVFYGKFILGKVGGSYLFAAAVTERVELAGAINMKFRFLSAGQKSDYVDSMLLLARDKLNRALAQEIRQLPDAACCIGIEEKSSQDFLSC